MFTTGIIISDEQSIHCVSSKYRDAEARALVHPRERERGRWTHTVRHHRTTVPVDTSPQMGQRLSAPARLHSDTRGQATGQVQTHSCHIDVRVSTYGLRMLAHVIQSEKAQVGVEACASQKFRKSH